MKTNVKILLHIVLFLTFASSIHSQSLPSSYLKSWSEKSQDFNNPTIGHYTFRGGVFIQAHINLPVLGNISNVYDNMRNGRIYVGKDVLIMELSYRHSSYCVNRTETLIDITSFSPEDFKYEDNPKLSIYLDNKLLISENMKLEREISTIQHFSVNLDPDNFKKILKSQNVLIQLADTQIKLGEKSVESLSKLSNLILNYKAPDSKICHIYM